MLTMPIDRITLLLERACEVWSTPAGNTSEGKTTLQAESTSDGLDQGIVDMPAYREFAALVNELDPEEIYELLAVATICESDDVEKTWDVAVRRAEALAIEDAASKLARLLVLTDAIEIGLDRLGYLADVENEDTEEDEIEDEDGVESVNSEEEKEGNADEKS